MRTEQWVVRNTGFSFSAHLVSFWTSPHISWSRPCSWPLWRNPEGGRRVTSAGAANRKLVTPRAHSQRAQPQRYQTCVLWLYVTLFELLVQCRSTWQRSSVDAGSATLEVRRSPPVHGARGETNIRKHQTRRRHHTSLRCPFDEFQRLWFGIDWNYSVRLTILGDFLVPASLEVSWSQQRKKHCAALHQQELLCCSAPWRTGGPRQPAEGSTGTEEGTACWTGI